MEIRKLKPEEMVAKSLVSAIVFLGSLDVGYKERLANPLDHSEGYEKVWGAFDKNGRIFSCATIHNFKIRFDGHTVEMGGVGNVCTLPEYRHGGSIRKIFEKALPEMKEQGKVFSYLYPFSNTFYRKFGYEVCNAKNELKIPIGHFSHFPVPENMEMHEPGGDFTGYAQVYDKFIANMNLPILRDAATWAKLYDKDPYISRQYAYLHRDKTGNPDAYIIFSAEGHTHEGIGLKVHEIAWTGPCGLNSVFGFINGMSAQTSHISWVAPGSFNPYPMFPNCDNIEISRPASGMNRIVDVKNALSLVKTPGQAGKAVISVYDNFMPQNTGVYDIEWDAGGPAEVKGSNSSPDMETDIETLAQLVTGFITPSQARHKKDFALNANEMLLNTLFPLKELYINHHF